MASQKVFTLSQVAQHRSKKDCWFVINGRVLDVTKFLNEHPAGEEVLIEVAGKDATKQFDNIGHSKEAQNLLLKYQVGVLQGHAFTESDKNAFFVESTRREMSASVIKDDKMPKYAAFLEFVLPLVFTGFYLSYRYL
ncbi:CYTOCHROME B5 [Salix viminalis]|uniref:CYTOCHROME B5 n=1 Tax=Salix viminalis TaxID=40686 RepID=A0A9Q0NTZ4_SALVM|nr:CYTOCHROME B5 [Salix viminalis]